MYTIKELINLLKEFPSGAQIELDCEGAIYEEFHIEQVGKRVVIFSQGESKW